MAIDRRSFIVGAALMLPAGRAFAASLDGGMGATFVSACRQADGSYAVLLLSSNGRIVRQIPLSARGHDIALHMPTSTAVAFARRPGTFAVAFDLNSRRAPVLFETPPGRHFFGHGAFSPDGRLLYATENDIDEGQGVLGMYDATGGFARVGEMPTFGVGPHEVILLRGGTVLAVANGGIDTHPEAGRASLNPDGMEPSLVFIDAGTGALIARHRLGPEFDRLSIRHLAEDERGHVWFGCQWEGDPDGVPELIGSAGVNTPIALLESPEPLGQMLKGYIASVAIGRDGRYLAASASRAGRIVYVDTQARKVCGQTRLPDGSGVAGMSNDVFALSSGQGDLELDHLGQERLARTKVDRVAFDNHLRILR